LLDGKANGEAGILLLATPTVINYLNGQKIGGEAALVSIAPAAAGPIHLAVT
jgi:hypothetical protein